MNIVKEGKKQFPTFVASVIGATVATLVVVPMVRQYMMKGQEEE